MSNEHNVIIDDDFLDEMPTGPFVSITAAQDELDSARSVFDQYAAGGRVTSRPELADPEMPGWMRLLEEHLEPEEP